LIYSGSSSFTQSDLDFQILSEVFFLKNADFLEFHWLVLLRSGEKAGWEEEQDAMLMECIKYGMFELWSTA
jgi:hypothetical protein